MKEKRALYCLVSIAIVYYLSSLATPQTRNFLYYQLSPHFSCFCYIPINKETTMHKRVFNKKRRRSSITCLSLADWGPRKPELPRVPCDSLRRHSIYIGIAPSTPLLTKGRTSCCIYTNMHRRSHQSPSEQFLKFPRFQSVRRKRVNVVLIKSCQATDFILKGSSMPSIHGMTLQR